MNKITVIIITLNEEKNIGNTLDAACRVADEIIVVDSGSTDNTKSICVEKGAIFIYQQWLGYGPQRNFAVSNAANDYILSLDADETMDDALIEAIKQKKQNGFAEKIYTVHRRNFYFGKFMHYGMERADIKARLYHKAEARWDDKLVHENLSYPRKLKTVQLKGYLLHYTYWSIEAYTEKTNRYSTLGAQQYYLSGKSEPGFIKLVLSPAFTFLNAYLFKAGFLDGWHGLILAKFQANAVLQKYAKLKMIYLDKRKK